MSGQHRCRLSGEASSKVRGTALEDRRPGLSTHTVLPQHPYLCKRPMQVWVQRQTVHKGTLLLTETTGMFLAAFSVLGSFEFAPYLRDLHGAHKLMRIP